MNALKPYYQVGAAPHHRCDQLAFSAFSVATVQNGRATVAYVVVVAEAATEQQLTDPKTLAGDTAPGRQVEAAKPVPASHHAVALIRKMIEQESALPVVRRLVEALRQTNHILHVEKQGVRVVAGVIMGNVLYVTCVGNACVHILRQEQPAFLLRADCTRDRCLGQSPQLRLDYQLRAVTDLVSAQRSVSAPVHTEHFVLAPGDTVVFCSSEFALEQIRFTTRYAGQPGRLAGHLARISMGRAGGLSAGIVVVRWHVNTLLQVVKQLLVVLVISLCVTIAMQTILFFTHQAAWISTHATARSGLPPFLPGPTAEPDTITLSEPGSSRTVVKVHVSVNVDSTTADQAPTLLNTLATNASSATPFLTPSRVRLPPMIVTLLAPEDKTTSSDQIIFAWQSDGALPSGYGYEVIIWQEGQTPLRDGVSIAPPTPEQQLPVQLNRLYDVGLIAPGVYRWGILLVKIDPYARLEFLGGGREFYFAGRE